MAKLSLFAGTTSKTIKILVKDTSKTNGAGLTGLAFGTSGLTCYYIREGANTTTSVTLQTSTLGTWTTRGFIVVDATNMPGAYEFGVPDAALAAGAKSVVIFFQGAANMWCDPIEIELTAVDNQSTGFGLVNASANISQINGQSASASGTVTFPNATLASTTNITAGTITTVTNLTNAPTAGDFTATMKTSLNNSTPASITGAVGSVTGNVGGNVVGSVGSVIAAVSITSNVKKNQALAAFPFIMYNSTNNQPQTGLTVTATRSIDGGAFAACANAVVEVGNGDYKIDLAAADLNGNTIMLQFTAAASLASFVQLITQP